MLFIREDDRVEDFGMHMGYIIIPFNVYNNSTGNAFECNGGS